MTPDPTILWHSDIEFPTAETMPDLDIVTHVSIERAQPGGFHYLHEPTIAFHQKYFHICWANHPIREHNTDGEQIRGVQSAAGLDWSTPSTWLKPDDYGSESWNHPVLFSHNGVLWGFFTRWNDEIPSTEIFRSEDGQHWETTGAQIEGFVPFRVPEKLPNGNWIIGGELKWETAAVAISDGDDWQSWRTVVIPHPPEIELMFPEVTLLSRGEQLVAIMRPHKNETALVSASNDWGESWTPIEPGNLPSARSQPYCGQLSTGQQFLLFNPFVAENRTLLAIAVTEPGESTFKRVWKVRHQKWPAIRLLGHRKHNLIGGPTQWSYPGVVEHDGNLYVVYTHGKEDCALSIIPLSALKIKL